MRRNILEAEHKNITYENPQISVGSSMSKGLVIYLVQPYIS